MRAAWALGLARGAAPTVVLAATVSACGALLALGDEPPEKVPPDSGADDAAGDCPAAAATDFYVDASGDGGTCTFSTIDSALQAARSSTAPARTIHLAAGTYANSAEFPIDLRGGISLSGAGMGMTVLAGTGRLEGIIPPINGYAVLSASSAVNVTIVVGDPVKTTRVSDVSFVQGSSSIAGTEAILCDRGNASTSSPPPPPNTLVSHVGISGFEVAVRATWSSPPASGCNLSLASSVLMKGWYGVIADGEIDNGSGEIRQMVAVQVGDLSGGGNTFADFHAAGPLDMNGAGVASGRAATGVIEGNRFTESMPTGSDWGVWIAHTGPYEEPGFDIEGNEFGPLNQGGVSLWGPVVVDKLIDNSFHDNSMQYRPNYGWLGLGVDLAADVTPSLTPFPVVQRARRNTFFGNDVGVMIRSAATPFANNAGLSTDFGNALDPGENTFRCNSAPPALLSDGPGADVLVSFQTADPLVATVPFEGNVWDHAPPTVVVAPFPHAPRGTDVYVVGDDAGAPFGATIDAADASFADGPSCPWGRVPGP